MIHQPSQVGLLAYGSSPGRRLPILPQDSGFKCRPARRSQWRYRGGFAPPSLFSPREAPDRALYSIFNGCNIADSIGCVNGPPSRYCCGSVWLGCRRSSWRADTSSPRPRHCHSTKRCAKGSGAAEVTSTLTGESYRGGRPDPPLEAMKSGKSCPPARAAPRTPHAEPFGKLRTGFV